MFSNYFFCTHKMRKYIERRPSKLQRQDKKNDVERVSFLSKFLFLFCCVFSLVLARNKNLLQVSRTYNKFELIQKSQKCVLFGFATSENGVAIDAETHTDRTKINLKFALSQTTKRKIEQKLRSSRIATDLFIVASPNNEVPVEIHISYHITESFSYLLFCESFSSFGSWCLCVDAIKKKTRFFRTVRRLAKKYV